MSRKVGFLLALVVLMVPLIASCGGETDAIKIGLQAPLTGAFAAEGQWAQQCVEIAAQMINDNGGVLGKNIEIVVVDDASNPKDGTLAAQKLISQGLRAVIATYGSTVTAPSVDLYDANEVVLVG